MVAISAISADDRDIVTKTYFRAGLVGIAKRWYDYLPSADKHWLRLRTKFLEKFKNGDPSRASRFILEAFVFFCEYGEKLNDYLKRAETLAN